MENEAEKPAKRWWQKKRYFLLAPFFCWLVLSFAESAFINYLIARQMEDHFDFDRRYAELLASDEYGSYALEEEVVDWLGYTHRTSFWRLRPERRSNTISYSYLRPKGRLSLFDALLYDGNADKIRIGIATSVDGKINKF